MNISRLHLTHFRNHADREFVFDPNVTIISGPNGSGKTNILEAIYVLATGKSFRDGDDDLTQYNQQWWKVRGEFDGELREVRYQDEMKSLIIGDSGERKRFSKSHRIPVVLFEPDDLYLIHGSPSARRKYIDAVIAVVTPGYATTLRRYERALAQRNRLLKSSCAINEDELFVWDIMLAEQAEVIVLHRRALVHQWNNKLSDEYSLLSGRAHTIAAHYCCNIRKNGYKQALLSHLKNTIHHDRMVGSTSIGPHRDDIEFFCDNQSFATSGSRGEIRSLLLALTFYEALLIRNNFHQNPIMLFDDVFSELDHQRQVLFIERASQQGQCIVSSVERTHGLISPVSMLLLGQV